MSNTKKRILIIFSEGPTDEEFYKRVIQYTKAKNKCAKYNFDEIRYMCACGIGNLHKKMLAKFKFEICREKKYANYEKVVCFCYDKDVFKKTISNPPINRTQMIADFKANGADIVLQVVADDMIEDFFLYDFDGIRKFLKLPSKYKRPGLKSLELLKKMYKDGNKIYTKGEKAEGLVDALDMDKILSKICCQLHELCKELGYKCQGDKCSDND